MKFGLKQILAITATTSLVYRADQADAFSPLPLNQISTKPSSIVGGQQSTMVTSSTLMGKPITKRIDRDWTYVDEGTNEEYKGEGKITLKVFLPKDGKVKGCAFFMHGFSQYTKAYSESLERVADHANIAIISPDTGITSGIVLGELLKNPFALIADRNRPQFVLQRALLEDTKQCVKMVLAGAEDLKEFSIGKNVPKGICGHSMGGGLSFPLAASPECKSINYVFTMAPVAGVPQFDPIKQGVDKRAVKNSMLLAGSWDLIGKADKVKDISVQSNMKQKDSSAFVEIARGLHTGFEDKLVITRVSLPAILRLVLGPQAAFEIFLLGLIRSNTGQLEGSELLWEFFFDKMVKNQKVTPKAAEQYLDENLKERWLKNFDISNE
jgi:hypothetical protein